MLVQEILSTSPQYLLNSVSANETSFAVIASRNDLDCSLIRRFLQWFTERRFAFCRTSFLAERDCGTVCLQYLVTHTQGRTGHYPKMCREVNPPEGVWHSDKRNAVVFFPF